MARTWAICSLRTPSLAAETPFREPIPRSARRGERGRRSTGARHQLVCDEPHLREAPRRHGRPAAGSRGEGPCADAARRPAPRTGTKPDARGSRGAGTLRYAARPQGPYAHVHAARERGVRRSVRSAADRGGGGRGSASPLVLRAEARQGRLNEGEFIIVPRAVEHRPVADEEVHVLLFEPATTLNTGNVVNERTVEKLERI